AEVKGIPRAKRRAKVDEVIQRCGIDSVACRLIGKLSKGYRQRVGIAQSLLHDPDVLILDEPTIGLDPKQIIEIRNLIKSLGGKQTVILSTHILPEVSMTCDRVIIIHEGRLVAVDTPANLIKHLQEVPTVLIKAEGRARDIMDALSKVPGVLSVKEASSAYDVTGFHVETQKEGSLINELARTVCDGGWKLREIRPVDMTLEEIFIKLVTKE
ncbi:MAG: ATP-binding cassette domain-containing protein, partial [Proteobacteria bacterium]|nr:ATP-binding cassette domain-containing protein [Pseudomonadota bacterium]